MKLTYISAEQFVLVIFVTKYQLLQNDNKNNEPFYTQKGNAKDIFDNIVPYLRRNYDSKIHRAIIKSHCLPMIFNPIHYFSKTTNNDWFIYYYAINKKFSKDAACIAASEVQTEEGTYVYEYIIAGEHNIYIFPPHFSPDIIQDS